MRNRFDEQLEQLNVGLIKMGALCEESIACAVKALFDEKTSEMITKVNDNEEETDHMEHDIEALCMKLLLHQQPVAKDLRCVSSASEDDLRHGAYRRPVAGYRGNSGIRALHRACGQGASLGHGKRSHQHGDHER